MARCCTLLANNFAHSSLSLNLSCHYSALPLCSSLAGAGRSHLCLSASQLLHSTTQLFHKCTTSSGHWSRAKTTTGLAGITPLIMPSKPAKVPTFPTVEYPLTKRLNRQRSSLFKDPAVERDCPYIRTYRNGYGVVIVVTATILT